jgi:hypothetical protein
MASNFKQHRLLSENYNRSRALGLKTPQNLGVVSNRADTAVPDGEEIEENMRLSMKHMHGGPHDEMDDDDAMMNRGAGGDEDMEDDDDLGVGDDNDLDSAEDAEDMGDEDMGDGDEDEDEMGDEDGDEEDMGDEGMGDEDEEDMGDEEEGDEEYPNDEEDELGALEKKAPPVGRPHDSAAFMARHMSEAKKMPPWLNKGKDKEGCEDKGSKGKEKEDSDKKGKKGKFDWAKKGKKEDKKPEVKDKGEKKNMKADDHKKGCKCKKCMCSSGMKMNMKEAFKDTKIVDRMDKKEFAKRIAEQYWQSDDRKFFSGVIEEDMLLPNKNQVKAPNEGDYESGPGEVGYAPQGRIGEFQAKALAEAVQHLTKEVERLKRKLNQIL